MTINWKLRFKNKTTLVAILVGIVALVYQICGLLGIVPGISENEVTNIIATVVDVLVLLGVVVDPTTSGIGDSEQALTYTEPESLR